VQVQKTGMLAKYGYDAVGRRMSKTVNGISNHYRYDGQSLILEMNSNDSVMGSYTYGLNTDFVLLGNRDGKVLYYLKDGLGSIAALTDSLASKIVEYRYDAFGNIDSVVGDTSLTNLFTYTSRELDKETGLYFCRARYYSSNVGRFTQLDPAQRSGAGRSAYGYVSNDPFNFADIFGLCDVSINWGSNGSVSGSFSPAPMGVDIKLIYTPGPKCDEYRWLQTVSSNWTKDNQTSPFIDYPEGQSGPWYSTTLEFKDKPRRPHDFSRTIDWSASLTVFCVNKKNKECGGTTEDMSVLGVIQYGFSVSPNGNILPVEPQ
jgi:RHS repeat-associated protein